MKKQAILLFVLLVSCIYHAKAQNKSYDWGIGVNAGTFSYSALLENRLTNPHEYSIGSGVTVSRYLNNHFDISLAGYSSSINYPAGKITGEIKNYKYVNTTINGAKFTLKYKLDNGIILPEHSMFAPYFLIGGGAYQTAIEPSIVYTAPVGVGINVSLGKRTSIFLESQYNHDFIGDLSVIENNIGVKVHFGKANRKRVKATKARLRKKKYAKIRKYRSKQRIAQAEKARNQLRSIQSEELASGKVFPSKEQDNDLLLTDQTIALNPNDEISTVQLEAPPIKRRQVIVEPGEAPSKPAKPASLPPGTPSIALEEEESTITSMENLTKKIEPTIPESPGKSVVTETEPIVNPPIQKPIIVIEEPIIEPTEIKEVKEIIEIPETIVAETILKPENTTIVRPGPAPIAQVSEVCRNSESELSEIGLDINFDVDRSRIRSRMHADLRAIIKILNECEDYTYVIIAHTDGDGNFEYNKKLAKKRANAIKTYLVSQGVDSKRLITVAYGSKVPVLPNTSEENKAKNRRIEFKLNREGF
jgi:outer membrane protein OmpA-like peptidoglycan-associated protein